VRCDFADSLLQGYFDGELSNRSAVEFERHLQHCVHCGSELVDLGLLRDTLHLAQLYEPASGSLRRKIGARLHATEPTIAPTKPFHWHWVAAAATLLFMVIVVWRLSPALHSDDYQAELAGEIVDAHVRSLQPDHTNGIASNDVSVVKTWLDGRAGFGVPVHNFANDGFALQGGRVDVIEGRAVAVLVYERNLHPINVFIWRSREPDTSLRTGSRQGFQWVDWRNSKMEFCAVSDAGLLDLEQLHKLIDSSG